MKRFFIILIILSINTFIGYTIKSFFNSLELTYIEREAVVLGIIVFMSALVLLFLAKDTVIIDKTPEQGSQAWEESTLWYLYNIPPNKRDEYIRFLKTSPGLIKAHVDNAVDKIKELETLYNQWKNTNSKANSPGKN